MKKKSYALTLTAAVIIAAGCLLSGCGRQPDGRNTDSEMLGKHISFGTYQGEEIEWRVIDADDEDGTILLLSEYGLDILPYQEGDHHFNVTWADCSLRRWLNEEFYAEAFTGEEQKKILPSTSEGFPKYNSRMPGMPYDKLERETEDKIFLLSYTEVQEYIPCDANEEAAEERRCNLTEYAKNKANPYLIADDASYGWWLCAGSRSENQNWPYTVSAYGGMDSHVDPLEYHTDYAVRPAMWIKQ